MFLDVFIRILKPTHFIRLLACACIYSIYSIFNNFINYAILFIPTDLVMTWLALKYLQLSWLCQDWSRNTDRSCHECQIQTKRTTNNKTQIEACFVHMPPRILAGIPIYCGIFLPLSSHTHTLIHNHNHKENSFFSLGNNHAQHGTSHFCVCWKLHSHNAVSQFSPGSWSTGSCLCFCYQYVLRGGVSGGGGGVVCVYAVWCANNNWPLFFLSLCRATMCAQGSWCSLCAGQLGQHWTRWLRKGKAIC